MARKPERKCEGDPIVVICISHLLIQDLNLALSLWDRSQVCGLCG